MAQARRPNQYTGVRPINPPNVIYADRAPTSSDTAYVRGDFWLNVTGQDSYQYGGGGSWISLGTSSVGSVDSLTGGTGGAILPTAGNISILGTANQITSTGSAGGHSITFSLPSAITAPGSLTTTTTLSSGTTITAGTGLTVTTGNILASSGNVTLTAGNVIINGAGKQLQVHGGAVTDFIGQATLASGTVTVSNTNIAAADKVLVQRRGINGSTALGLFNVAISAATSFTITALKPADATTETNDASIVDYVIVRQV